jgi:transcriptional regulator with XRE-family HTH domain
MDKVGAFSDKLGLAMRALSLSRVALAQALGVDKSLVGRWLSGAVHPTEHNLARLTALVGARDPAFRLADWFGDAAGFAERFGLAAPPPPPSGLDPLAEFFGPFLDRARGEALRRGSAYEGFWRSSRPSLLMTERLFHDYALIRCAANGLLEIRIHGAGLAFTGWALPGEGNLFGWLQDPVGMTPMSLVFRGVTLPRAMVLDGLLMLAGLDPSRTLGALPIVLERVGDLSGDSAADDARCNALGEEGPEPLEPLGEEILRARIFRDTGPATIARGGPAFLSVGAQDSLSRGTTSSGLTG